MSGCISSGLFFHPTYINFLYGDQGIFQRGSKEAIEAGIRHVETELKSGQDPNAIFLALYQILTEYRHEIAQQQDSKNKKLFGLSRCKEGNESYASAYTPLEDSYQSYGNLAITQITEAMMRMGMIVFEGGREELKKRKEESFDEAWGRTWRIEIELLDIREKTNFILDPADPLKGFPPYIRRHFDGEVLHLCDRDDWIQFSEEEPDLFKRTNMTLMVTALCEKYPSDSRKILPYLRDREQNTKSDYVRATIFMDIDRKAVPLAQMITWMNRDDKEPTKKMKKDSVVYLVHQDFALHRITAVALSQIFAWIITWKKRGGGSIKQLQEQMALFRFIFALCMPSFRGDGAVGDWMEEIAFAVNGVKLVISEKTLTPFEPLALAIAPGKYTEQYLKSRIFV